MGSGYGYCSGTGAGWVHETCIPVEYPCTRSPILLRQRCASPTPHPHGPPTSPTFPPRAMTQRQHRRRAITHPSSSSTSPRRRDNDGDDVTSFLHLVTSTRLRPHQPFLLHLVTTMTTAQTKSCPLPALSLSQHTTQRTRGPSSSRPPPPPRCPQR